jgi:DNA polymerase-3 subunit alpha
MKHGQKLHREKTSGQSVFFSSFPTIAASPSAASEHHVSSVDEWSEGERLSGEYAMLGFYISGHPLDKFAGRLKELNAVEIGSLEGRRNGSDVIVAGIIVQSRPMRSKKGARWAIATLQDQTGVVEALIFPEAFQRLEPVLKGGSPLVVKGRINVEEAGTRLAVAEAKPIEQMLQRAPALLCVRVDLKATDPEMLNELDQLMASRPGRCRVEFDLLSDDGTEAKLESARSVQVDPDLLDRIRGICGPDAIVMQK